MKSELLLQCILICIIFSIQAEPKLRVVGWLTGFSFFSDHQTHKSNCIL